MSLSILLLLILQGFWLQNSYEKAYNDLRREANFLFRNTIFSLRDSLFLKNVKPLAWDSLPAEKIDAVKIFNKSEEDSMKISVKSSTVQVFVKSEAHSSNDSIIKALRPMAQHFNKSMGEGKSFVIRLAPDTIRVDTINTVLTKALIEAELPHAFQITLNTLPPEEMRPRTVRTKSLSNLQNNSGSEIFGDTIMLEEIRLNPLNTYSASLFNFNSFLLQSIAPQIIFSVLLTVITIVAFVVLYRSLRSQQRLMELKNDFISNITHELKTPVATVSVALEALKNFHALSDPARTKEYLEIAQNELNRLTLMTDKILKASSFENNGVAIQKESVDLDRIINQIMDSMKLVFEKNHANVTFTKEGVHFLVDGNAEHLTNVIYNLVDNALKYSPENAQLVITLKEHSDFIELQVLDKGIGIPSEYKKKIFEKFFRVPTGDVHNTKGYGLGLSYVASVVKELHGKIDVTSEPGKGSIFNIQLPKSSA